MPLAFSEGQLEQIKTFACQLPRHLCSQYLHHLAQLLPRDFGDAGDNPEAIVLDFMQPDSARRRLRRCCGEAGRNEARWQSTRTREYGVN